MTASILLCVVGLFFVVCVIVLAASLRIVREDTRLTVYRLGRLLGDRGPGLVLLIPFVDRGEIRQLAGADQTPSTRMVGVVGETRTSVFRDGKVTLSGEEWDALSQTPIAAGRRVRVVRTFLEVEEE